MGAAQDKCPRYPRVAASASAELLGQVAAILGPAKDVAAAAMASRWAPLIPSAVASRLAVMMARESASQSLRPLADVPVAVSREAYIVVAVLLAQGSLDDKIALWLPALGVEGDSYSVVDLVQGVSLAVTAVLQASDPSSTLSPAFADMLTTSATALVRHSRPKVAV